MSLFSFLGKRRLRLYYVTSWFVRSYGAQIDGHTLIEATAAASATRVLCECSLFACVGKLEEIELKKKKKKKGRLSFSLSFDLS
jgi:hypothetical protein